MNIYAGLLFNQGYVADPGLARSLAPMPQPGPGDAAPPTTGAGTPQPAPTLPRPRRRHAWGALQAALLAALR